MEHYKSQHANSIIELLVEKCKDDNILQQVRMKIVENCFHFERNNDIIPVSTTDFFFNDNFIDLAKEMDGKQLIRCILFISQ